MRTVPGFSFNPGLPTGSECRRLRLTGAALCAVTDLNCGGLPVGMPEADGYQSHS